MPPRNVAQFLQGASPIRSAFGDPGESNSGTPLDLPIYMKFLGYIFCCLLLCSYAGKPPYQAKLACRTRGNACRFHLTRDLEVSIKSAIATWTSGSVDVSIVYRIKNTNRIRPDSINFKALLMACSNGIPIQQETARDAAKDHTASDPDICTIRPSASIDTVLHFFSQGRFSRMAAIGTIKNDLFFLRHANGAIDTLVFAAEVGTDQGESLNRTASSKL